MHCMNCRAQKDMKLMVANGDVAHVVSGVMR